MVDKGVIDIEENESCEWFKVHAVPPMRYMGRSRTGLQKMQHEIHAENEGGTVPVQLRWLASPHGIKRRRQKGEISASSVVFVVKGSKVTQRLVKEGIKAVGVWYRVKPFMNAAPDPRCEHRRGWDHIESKCSGKRPCGYCSGLHRTSDNMCNVVGCTAKLGALCGHTQENCPNCRGNHISFSCRCAKKAEVTRVAPEERRRETAGPTMRGRGAPTGTNKIALGQRAEGLGGGGRARSEEEMADVVCPQEPPREREGVGISHLAYNIRKRKTVWMAVGKGSGFPNNERTDLSKNPLSDVIVVDIECRGDKMTRIVNIYDQREGETGERPSKRLNWQRIIRDG